VGEMKNIINRTVSIVLAITLIIGLIPLDTFSYVFADMPSIYTLSNDYININVSSENGGFQIETKEGDKVNKDDNNKNLLFPSSLYDTSYTSFRITKAGESKDYIFGRDYGFLGLSSSDVVLTQDDTGITATWSLDNLTFTQRISLANTGSNEHGMVYISYNVENKGKTDVDIKARVMLDTALGYKDFAYYELPGANNVLNRVENEKVIGNSGSELAYEKTFFAYDDVNSPTITAYLVNAAINNKECKPYQVAFGHWNNLASSVFDFTPDSSLTFTNQYNKRYLTADSAYALYYDYGTIKANEKNKTIAMYYGVFSNEKVTAQNRVAVNITAPSALELSTNNKEYKNDGKFTISTTMQNFVSHDAKKLDKVAIAVYTQNGMTALDSYGNPLAELPTYNSPYKIIYQNIDVGATQITNWNFDALVDKEANYRKIEFKVFDMTNDPTGSGQLLLENLIGSAYCYILCPGGDGLLPEIQFTGSSPKFIYNEGLRHLYLTGKNFNMLDNRSEYTVIAKRTDGISQGGSFVIPANNFVINSTENTADVIFTDLMPVGSYELLIDWINVNKKDITAPALKFTISDDKKYKNDSYGVAAIIQSNSSVKKYELKVFSTEDVYQDFKGRIDEVIIELRGSFTVKNDASGNVIQVIGTSVDSSNANVKNLMTINNCLDFENGILTVDVENIGSETLQKIKVNFDGKLYTSGARTSVWTGVAGFTSINNGTDYELISYDEQGIRIPGAMADKYPITLIWPSAASAAQTLAGMVMSFRYGELGIIRNGEDDELQRVLSFGAQLDLSFLIPSGSKTKPNLTAWETITLLLAGKQKFTADELRDKYELYEKDVKAKGQEVKGVAAANINDILFGGGFIGFNSKIDLTLPSYTPAMPKIEGSLTINTIGDWKIGVYGKAKFIKMQFEAEIKLRGKDGFPVPDKLYFYMAGFTPGLNVDGFGVLWIQGAGGGIDNLFETIFPVDSIPPLKILLSAKLALLCILEAKADLSLSLRGLGVKLTDGKIVDTDLNIINSARLQFDWYPDFYFLASVNMNIIETIKGAGYMVVEDDGFFEFFIRAAISIPQIIPLIGGMTLAQAELGANALRVWGVLEVLMVRLGITYYWGGDFEFGAFGKSPKPTYPELLGFKDIPVYYDKETERTLYMHVGSNIGVLANAETVENLNTLALRRIGDVAYAKSNDIPSYVANYSGLLADTAYVKSNAAKTSHIVNLGSKGTDDAILEMKFTADSIEAAKQFTISDGSKNYNLVWYDNTKNADDVENKNANAYINYDNNTRMASVAISFTDAASYSKNWNIGTSSSADLRLLNIEQMPEFNILNYTYNNGTVTANWDGSLLEQVGSISFFAVKDENDIGTLIYKITDTAKIQSKHESFALPEKLPSGTYYIKAVATKENVFSNTLISPTAMNHINKDEPNSPSSVSIANGGDFTFDVEVGEVTGVYDGYMVNIYEEQTDGSFELNSSSGLLYDKDKAKFTVGGQYSYTDELSKVTTKQGLIAGKRYKIGVSSYKLSSNDIMITSKETLSSLLKLNTPIATNINCVANKPFTQIKYIEGKVDGIDNVVLVDTFKDKDLLFTISANTKVTGKWTLDNIEDISGKFGNITEQSSFNIDLKDLSEGNHSLAFIGTNEYGDGVIFQKRFSVDTLAPKLLLTTPVNGGLFEKNGDLKISGVTDKKATIKVTSNTKVLYNEKPTVDDSGFFSITIKLDNTKASHNIEIYAIDEVGNSINDNLSVVNKSLGDIVKLEIYDYNQNVTNKSLQLNQTGDTVKQLSLKALTSTGQIILIDDSTLVEWHANSFNGKAAITQDGSITLSNDAQGFVMARLIVSSNEALTAATTFGPQNDNAVIKNPENSSEDDDEPNLVIGLVTANAGDTVSYPLPKGVDINIVVPTYIVDGKTKIVPLCKVVDGRLIFKAPMAATYSIVENNVKFNDIATHWAKDSIKFMASRGIVNGIGANNFSPNQTLSRGMFVTMLGRLHGVDNYEYKTNPFKDVQEKLWYSNYAVWAYENGIINGISEGCFAPDKPASREEICVILTRYLKWRNEALETNLSEKEFNDKSKISSWALDAVEFCHSTGLIQGNENGDMLPRNSITRAENCTMLMRLIKLLVR
jgi:hypothetical protein